MYDIAGVEATEPEMPVEEMITKAEYMKRKLEEEMITKAEYMKRKLEEEMITKAEYMKRKLEEVDEATEEPCCASATRRKAKLVFKKIR